MNPQLQHLLLERLTAHDALDGTAADLVLTACEGRDALAAALSDGTAKASRQATQPPAEEHRPLGAYLASIAVTGFRGIGEPAELRFPDGPGLTLVVGRNGSGKSSFAEGLELLMTGENHRWSGRAKIWTEGWRNLHHDRGTTIAATMRVEGMPGLLGLKRGWSPDEALYDASIEIVAADGQPTSLSALGWDAALLRYRPFLSYNELGSMFDEPKTMYDALSAILGLDDIEQMAKDIRDERLERDRAAKAVRQEIKELLPGLDQLEDARATAAAAALRQRPPDLDAIELALVGAIEGGDPEGDLAALRALTTPATPRADETAAAFTALQDTEHRLAALAGSDAARAASLADLLDAALRHHASHQPRDCPVCGTTDALGSGWHQHATIEADRLRGEAAAVESARQDLAHARAQAADQLSAQPPATVDRVEALGLDATALREAWGNWRLAREGIHTGSADAAQQALTAVRLAARPLADRAREELDRREDLWRPIAAQLAEWLPGARNSVAASDQLSALKAAEAWVKEAATELRAARLAPIADRAKANWERLRQDSNVTLETFALRRSGNVRSADVDVRVDGTDASAFGVMSQGELHALAMSVFLPRAALDESPFRFMVIDDPVQSMDPAKVDGLARVLAVAAIERQVIVFTHDERLAEAVRRLGLEATILEVTRRPGSLVEVRPSRDPIERYLADARALVRTDGLPEDVARRVVPGFCRQALEAACTATVRRRRLGRGDPHVAVEAALGEATTLMTHLALVLYDDASKGSQVLSSINNRFGRTGGDVVFAANKGAHAPLAGNLRDLVRDTAVLARKLQELS